MLSNIEYTKVYLLYLIKSFNDGWITFFSNLKQQSNIEELILMKMSLLHPYHLQSKELNGIEFREIQEKIQGRRAFLTNPITDKCSSFEIWGYECPFTHETLVLDHDFPYSLGGPTDNAYNKRILCRWHNMIKGNDIHTYNWKKLINDYKDLRQIETKHWVDLQLEKIKLEFKI